MDLLRAMGADLSARKVHSGLEAKEALALEFARSELPALTTGLY